MDRAEKTQRSLAHQEPAERQCGECSACCVRLPIPAGQVSVIEKPAGTPCPSLADCGCAIYPSRPTICRNFACTWLKLEGWPPEWRPDRIGLLCISERVGGVLEGSLVYELRPGALQSAAGSAAVASLLSTCDFVVTVSESGVRQLTPGLRLDRAESPPPAPHFPSNTRARRPNEKISGSTPHPFDGPSAPVD